MDNYNIEDPQEKKYKVRIYDEKGGMVFFYESTDFEQVMKVAEAFKLIFSDVEMTEH